MSNLRPEQWRRFRRRHKMTQADLAKVLGVNRYTVQNVEGGFSRGWRVRQSTLDRFAIIASKLDSERGIPCQNAPSH